jgi:hypothetical protein
MASKSLTTGYLLPVFLPVMLHIRVPYGGDGSLTRLEEYEPERAVTHASNPASNVATSRN